MADLAGRILAQIVIKKYVENKKIKKVLGGTKMNKTEIQERIGQIETYLANNDLTYTRMFVLAGEWEGLNKVIGNSESAMSMLWRTKGI